MPRRGPTGRFKLIQPPDRPPRGRPQLVDLLVRRTAEPGDVVRVRVARRGTRALLVGLPVSMRSMRGEPLALVVTDERGEACFVAPAVEHPSDVLFEPEDSRVTTYLDGNMWNTTGAGLEAKARSHLRTIDGMTLERLRAAGREP